jgi:hypothetical protein
MLSLFFVYKTLQSIGSSKKQQYIVLVMLAIWPKMIKMDSGGMETPLVILLMAVSWFTYVKKKITLTGIVTGLLLWTRIDLILWPIALWVIDYRSELRRGIQFVTWIGLTYIPWVIFSFFYFGSPIPHSGIAKFIAHYPYGQIPVTAHLLRIIKRLGPVSFLTFPGRFQGAAAVLTCVVCLCAGWRSITIVKNKKLIVLPLFALLDLVRIILMKATYSSRYLAPVLWTILIVCGLGLGEILELGEGKRRIFKYLLMAVMFVSLLTIITLGIQDAKIVREVQVFRNEKALKSIGIWINQNTQPDQTVQLEPLGYVGYYSDRYMLDVVGLITPQVVDLKQQGTVNPYQYLPILDPDIFVVHCDNIIQWQNVDQENKLDVLTNYSKVKAFNPLEFNPLIQEEFSIQSNLRRSSCYEIWQRDVAEK